MRSLFILLLAASAAFAQETVIFEAGVSLVKVDVQVTDGHRNVTGLGKADFRVFDNGEPRAITYFGHEKEALHVLLLLDVSGSTRKYVKQMAEAAREALQGLNPGDQVGLMVFSRRTEMRREFTSHIETISRAILGAAHARDLGSGTRINAAIIDAANKMNEALRETRGRRAIVILTDNSGLDYQIPNEKVVRALFGADTVLNAVAVGGARPPEPLQRGANPDFTPPDIFLLARETGGEVIAAKKAGDAFRRILDGIRTRYSLHFRAPEGESGTFHNLRVELSPEVRKLHRRAVLHARSGYYYVKNMKH